MSLSPASPEKDQITQLEILTRYIMSGFYLQGSGSGYDFVEYVSIGDLYESRTIDTLLTGST